MSMIAMSLAAALAAAQPGQQAAEQAQALFDAQAEHYPALNVTVMVEGEIAWEAEGGVARDAAGGVEQDYNVYSVAKMLTGLAYARLEESEGLDLDQSVRAIDPDLPEAYQPVTLRHLLSHTGGVRHYQGEADWRGFNDRRCETPADALGHFIDDPLAAAPGERFQYTTFGFTLLSHLLVRITGEGSYDAAMDAALGEGAYRARTDRDGADKAVNYREGMFGRRQAIALSAECKFGGGGLLASSRDLAAMGADFAAGEMVSLERIPELFQPARTNAGEALGITYGMSAGYAEEAGVHYAAHSGGSPGGRAFILVYVEPQISVALTSNFDGPNHRETAIAIADAFAGWTED